MSGIEGWSILPEGFLTIGDGFKAGSMATTLSKNESIQAILTEHNLGSDALQEMFAGYETIIRFLLPSGEGDTNAMKRLMGDQQLEFLFSVEQLEAPIGRLLNEDSSPDHLMGFVVQGKNGNFEFNCIYHYLTSEEIGFLRVSMENTQNDTEIGIRTYTIIDRSSDTVGETLEERLQQITRGFKEAKYIEKNDCILLEAESEQGNLHSLELRKVKPEEPDRIFHCALPPHVSKAS